MNDRAWHDGNPAAAYETCRAVERAMSRQRFLSYWATMAYYREPLDHGAVTSSSELNASLYQRAIDEKRGGGFNVLRSVITAAAAQIVRVPAVRAQTIDGDYKLRIAGRKLSTLCTGLVRSSGLADDALQVFVDACLYPVGGVKLAFDRDKELLIERVRPDWIVYNPAEGRRPANLFLHPPVARDFVRSKFGSDAAKKAMPYTNRDALARFDPGVMEGFYDADLVDVVDAWHLGSDADHGDGAYVCVSGSLVLGKDKYDLPEFPVVPFRWDDSFGSWGGDPAGWQLLPYQAMVDTYLENVLVAQGKACIPRVFLRKGAEADEMTETIAEIIRYVGEPPVIAPGQALPPEYYKFFDKILTAAYEYMGVSPNMAAGTTRPGLSTGRAIRESTDTAQGRLYQYTARFEAFFPRVMNVAMQLMSREYGNRSNQIDAPGTHVIEQIDWKDLKVVENKYRLVPMATSMMPQSPGARLEYVAELRETFGDSLPLDRLAQMLGMPDIEAWTNEQSAVADLVDRLVSRAIDDGEPSAPEPYLGLDGLNLLAKTATNRLLRALTDHNPPPPENLDACRRLIDRTKTMIAQITPKPPVTPAPPLPAGVAPPLPAAPPLPTDAAATPAAAPAIEGGMTA